MNGTTSGKKKNKRGKKGLAELLGAFLCCEEEHHMLRHISFFLLRFQCWAVAAASTHGGPGRSHRQHPMDRPSRELGSSRASFPFPWPLLSYHRSPCAPPSRKRACMRSWMPGNSLPGANRGRKSQLTASCCTWVPQKRPLPWQKSHNIHARGARREGRGVTQTVSPTVWGGSGFWGDTFLVGTSATAKEALRRGA